MKFDVVGKIAEEAGFSRCVNQFGDYMVIETDDIGSMEVQDELKRFAELIIKECCRIADAHLDSEHPAGEIANHFGVDYETEY
jgi:hypothetical protein